MADPEGKAVLAANFPDMAAHPMYESFKGMTLRALAPMSGGQITEEMLTKTEAGLAAVK